MTSIISGSDLLEQNLGLVFDLLDTDHDGYLIAGDLPASGQRILDEFAVTDPQKCAQVEDSYSAWWQRMLADCNPAGDGRVARQNLLAAFLSGGGGPNGYYQEMVAPIIDAVARVADPDGDGFIQAADYARIFASHGINGPFVAAAFGLLDTDHDGRISAGEFQNAVSQLVLSQNAADPGTVMLGP